MDFEKNVPNWEATGSEPPETLKSSGFSAGYKPPAAYFNWFWNGVSACLTELQTKVKAIYAREINGKSLEEDVTLEPSDIGAADDEHGHDAATTAADGFMSASDKEKLDGIEASANNYTHPTTSGNKHVPSGGVAGQVLDWSADGEAKWAVPNLPIVNATSTDGVTYTATLDGVTEFKAGDMIVFIPDKTTTTQTPTLNVNGLGDVQIRRKLSTGTATLSAGGGTTFFFAARPSLFIYDTAVSARPYWIALEFTQNSASDLYGTVKVDAGGTGADNAEDARANLGAAAITAITVDATSGDKSLTFTADTSNSEYRYVYASGITSLTVASSGSFANTVEAYYSVVFLSGTTATTITNTLGAYFSGDDCVDGVFTPAASKTYDLGFWWNGVKWQAAVRGSI